MHENFRVAKARSVRVIAVIALLFICIAAVLAVVFTRDTGQAEQFAAADSSSSPAVASTTKPDAEANNHSASPEAPPSSQPPVPTNEGPAPSTTGSFSMSGPAAVSGATFDSMPYVLPLNPAGPQETMVRWVEGWGQSPSNADAGTVYVLGHAWGQAPLVFNPISEVVTAHVDLSAAPEQVNGTDNMPVKRYSSDVLNGSEITMADPQGNARTWRVTRSWLVDKNEAIVDPDIMAADRRGRIVLIACSVSGSQDLGYNVIVEGQLV